MSGQEGPSKTIKRENFVLISIEEPDEHADNYTRALSYF